MKKLLLAAIILTTTFNAICQQYSFKSLGNKPAEHREMVQGATVNGMTAYSQLWLSTDRFKGTVESTEAEMKSKGFKKVDKATILMVYDSDVSIEYPAEAKMVYVVKILYSSFDGDMNVYWKHPETPGIGTKNTTKGYSENERSILLDEYSPASNAPVKLNISTYPSANAKSKQRTAVQILIFKKKK